MYNKLSVVPFVVKSNLHGFVALKAYEAMKVQTNFEWFGILF